MLSMVVVVAKAAWMEIHDFQKATCASVFTVWNPQCDPDPPAVADSDPGTTLVLIPDPPANADSEPRSALTEFRPPAIADSNLP